MDSPVRPSERQPAPPQPGDPDERPGASAPAPMEYARPRGFEYARPQLRDGSSRAQRWVGTGLAVVLVIALISLLLLLLGTPREQANRARCSNNLRQIALVCQMYAYANGGRFPDTINDVLLTQDITADAFVCPTTTDTLATGPTTQAVAADLTAGGHLSYVYVGKRLTNAAGSSTLAGTVLAYEPLTNHGDGVNVAYADAHVEWHYPATGGKIVAELQAGHNPPRPEKLR